MQAAKHNRRGMVLVYTMICMVTFIGICSLAVDWGRVQLTKTELDSAAVAAARGGAGALSNGPAAATSMAMWVGGQNRADGAPVTLASDQVQVGWWDVKALRFSSLTGMAAYRSNAVRVVTHRTAATSNAVSLSFGQVFGRPTQDVSTEAIAMYVAPIDVDQQVMATANPFLAGMPAGTVASLNNPHNSPDYAGDASNPRQSPMSVNMPLIEGQALTFDSIDGTARHDPNLSMYEPDGQLSDIGHNTNGGEHGIADINAPINALVGVFLTDDQPDRTATPASLDFSTDQSRDFNTLQPQNKQIFFIGDGLNSHGQPQHFIVPKGATRLYLATWDFYEWNNNAGARTVKVSRPGQVVLVK